jgi:GDP/UDP-N,N'-diacetylbacillosamine 2-epimerase (hydrolysing)
MTVNEIKDDGFNVSDEIYMAMDGYNLTTMAKSLGVFLTSFVDTIKREKPTWLVLAGDRGEQMMGAIAGAYMYIPTAHIQAGELSGNIDGLARHAIGKFVHLHFASNQDAAERLRKLGEEEFRIHNTGAPQLDELVAGNFTNIKMLEEKYSINLSKPYLLVAQHSVTEEFDQSADQIKASVDAINATDYQSIWIMPNNDAGRDIVRQAIIEGRKSKTYLFENLKREDYLGFLKNAECIIGNSSSGILEAPTFKIPAINIGRRQLNRLQGENVINVDYNRDNILSAIDLATSKDFRNKMRTVTNPYGDGRASERILRILKETKIDSKLLSKNLTY